MFSYTEKQISIIKDLLKSNPVPLFSIEGTKGLLLDILNDLAAADFFSRTLIEYKLFDCIRRGNFNKERYIIDAYESFFIDKNRLSSVVDFWTAVIDDELLKIVAYQEDKYIVEKQSNSPDKIYPLIVRLYENSKSYEQYKTVADYFKGIETFKDSKDYFEKSIKKCSEIKTFEEGKKAYGEARDLFEKEKWHECTIKLNNAIHMLEPYSYLENISLLISSGKELMEKSKNLYDESLRKERIYANVVQKISCLKYIDDYDDAIYLLKQIPDYKDSRMLLDQVALSRDTFEKNSIYNEASELLKKSRTIDEFTATLNLFSKIEDYKDSKRKKYVCYQRIKNLKDREKFDDIKKKIDEIDHLSDVNEKAKRYCQVLSENESDDISEEIRQIILECKEKRQKCLAEIRAKRQEELCNEFKKQLADIDKVEDLQTKEMILEKIISGYNSQADFEELHLLVKEAREKLEITKNEIKYLAAIKTLENATSEKDFLDAKKLFSELVDYKDCKEKSDFCQNKAIETANAQIYSEASELIKETDRINSFDILKSMFKRKKY